VQIGADGGFVQSQSLFWFVGHQFRKPESQETPIALVFHRLLQKGARNVV
jgi:hypothetical protein